MKASNGGSNISEEVNVLGFAIVPSLFSPSVMDRFGEALPQNAFAARHLLRKTPAVRELSESEKLGSLIEPLLGPSAFAVRGLLFDKIPGANWKVACH